jgi:hypothetical protein
MTLRFVGLTLLNLAGVGVIIGSLYDLLIPDVPANHLDYLGLSDGSIDPRFAALDLAMLRSIGGCSMAIGITTLVLVNGPIRRGETWALATVVVLVVLSEGNTAYRMYRFGSPWYGPLGFAITAVVGAVLFGVSERARRSSRPD